MSRNLLNSAKAYLGSASNVRVAHLVRLELAASTEAEKSYTYLTDYMTDIVHDNKTYRSGTVTKVGDVRQSQGLTNYTCIVLKIEFEESIMSIIECL